MATHYLINSRDDLRLWSRHFLGFFGAGRFNVYMKCHKVAKLYYADYLGTFDLSMFPLNEDDVSEDVLFNFCYDDGLYFWQFNKFGNIIVTYMR